MCKWMFSIPALSMQRGCVTDLWHTLVGLYLLFSSEFWAYILVFIILSHHNPTRLFIVQRYGSLVRYQTPRCYRWRNFSGSLPQSEIVVFRKSFLTDCLAFCHFWLPCFFARKRAWCEGYAGMLKKTRISLKTPEIEKRLVVSGNPEYY